MSDSTKTYRIPPNRHDAFVQRQQRAVLESNLLIYSLSILVAIGLIAYKEGNWDNALVVLFISLPVLSMAMLIEYLGQRKVLNYLAKALTVSLDAPHLKIVFDPAVQRQNRFLYARSYRDLLRPYQRVALTGLDQLRAVERTDQGVVVEGSTGTVVLPLELERLSELEAHLHRHLNGRA